MQAGRLDRRVTFQTATAVEHESGGESVSWGGDLEVWAEFRGERGSERLQAGRLTASQSGVLRVRSSPETRELTESDRVLIDDVPYQIRSIAALGRNDALEMTVEKGVAT